MVLTAPNGMESHRRLTAPNGMGAYTAEPDRVWLLDEEAKTWVPPRRIAEYIEWLLTPEWLREPRLVREFAESVGVHLQTLYRWRQDKRFQDALRARANELNSDVVTTQDVLNAVQNAAKNGNVKAAELWLKFRGELTPRVVVEQRATARDMSTPELIASLKQQVAALEAQEQKALGSGSHD